MAMGLQVVSGRDASPDDPEVFALIMRRRLEHPEPTRKLAEALFDPAESAKAFLRVATQAVN
jgi:hypothetical protein